MSWGRRGSSGGGLAVLHVEERLRIDRRRIRLSGRCRCPLVRRNSRRNRRRGPLPGAGGGEQMAGARRLGFLCDALLLRIGGRRSWTRRGNLRIEDGAAEVSWKRRPE